MVSCGGGGASWGCWLRVWEFALGSEIGQVLLRQPEFVVGGFCLPGGVILRIGSAACCLSQQAVL